MAIAVDASSPPRVTNTGGLDCTTAAFDPPPSILIATICGDADSAVLDVTVAMTNNGAALTWTEINTADPQAGMGKGFAAAYYAVLGAARTGMTVTGTSVAGTNRPSMQLYVVTGADHSDPVGTHAIGTSTANNLTTTGITTEAASGLGLVAANDWQALGAPTSSDSTLSTFNTGFTSGASGYKLLGIAGALETFNVDAPGGGTADWNYVTLEIKAAAGAHPLVRRPHVGALIQL